MVNNKIKVLIVDDSATIRKVLKEILSADKSIEIIAASSNPIIAMTRMEREWPDVIITDIEMPEMDGITFMKEIMAKKPTPFVICSTVDEQKIISSINAMSIGAIDIITKPKISAGNYLYESSIVIIDAVKSASQADLTKLKKSTLNKTKTNNKTEDKQPVKSKKTPDTDNLKVSPKFNADVILSPYKETDKNEKVIEKIIAIGASAGGTQAIETVLKNIPANSPGIVIVQHMPEKFTHAFSERLNIISKINVKEAENGDTVQQGLAIVARGGQHMMISRKNDKYYIRVKDGPLVSRHRPSVDVLFRSIAKNAGGNAMGIILTGMGDDGAEGMLEMKKSGITTIAQNRNTSVVFGMPMEAINRGGVDKILPIDKISEEIEKFSLK